MIYIVHGDDFSKTRIAVLNQQKKLEADSRIELEINNISPEDLFSYTRSSDLFGGRIFIVLNISKAGRTNLDPFISKLEKIPENVTLIVISDKQLSNANAFIKNASKLGAKIISNQKVPLSNTFKFADAVFYKQRDQAYRELSKLLLEDVEPLEIFSALVWNLRNISYAKLGGTDFFRGRDFIKNKANSQAKLFSKEAVAEIYWYFKNIDRDAKFGVIDFDCLVPSAVEKVLNS